MNATMGYNESGPQTMQMSRASSTHNATFTGRVMSSKKSHAGHVLADNPDVTHTPLRSPAMVAGSACSRKSVVTCGGAS